MAHIDLPDELPGITGPLAYRPETAKPLSELAEALLRGPSTLTRGERALIATYVSQGNACTFCTLSHRALAAAQFDGGGDAVDHALADPSSPTVIPKLARLLAIADAVRRSGRDVRPEDVAAAREAGATDVEIHDTVLIAAAFCMYNRYVDGLATFAPDDRAAYEQMAGHIVANGYMASMPE